MDKKASRQADLVKEFKNLDLARKSSTDAVKPSKFKISKAAASKKKSVPKTAQNELEVPDIIQSLQRVTEIHT